MIHESLENSARRVPERAIAVTQNGENWSYSRFLDVSNELAERLRAFGLHPGDRVAVYLNKHILSALLPFALSRLGLVFVPLNPALKARQVDHILSDSGSKLLVTSAARLQSLGNSLLRGNALHGIFLSDLPTEQFRVPMRLDCWESPIAQARAERGVTPSASSGSALAALLYTSGSTGLAKGVMLSHANLEAGGRCVAQYLNLSQDDVLLAALPFSFDYGLNQLLSAVHVGACCVLHDYFLAGDALVAVERYGVTGLAGVPTLWAQMAAAGLTREPLRRLRYFTNSGGHLHRAVLEKLRQLFPCAEPYLMYGLTEAFRSTFLPPSEIDQRPGSMGKAVPGAELFVVDEDGALALPEAEGELVHCGELVTGGYWNAPDKTAERFRPPPQGAGQREGSIAVWSGDIVRRDADGFFYFVGRKDGLVKTAGYRVSPEEIEEVLLQSTSVQEVCVFGVPDDLLGQAVIAAIVLVDGVVPDDSLLARRCARDLPNYMAPREFLMLPDIPKNANGKPDRIRLREIYEESRNDLLDSKAAY